MSPAAVTVTLTFTVPLVELDAMLATLQGKATAVSTVPAAGAAAETPAGKKPRAPKLVTEPAAGAASAAPAKDEELEDLFGGVGGATRTAPAKVWTLDEVKGEVNTYIGKHSTADVKKIMVDQFGAKRLVDIDAKRYAEFVAVLQK